MWPVVPVTTTSLPRMPMCRPKSDYKHLTAHKMVKYIIFAIIGYASIVLVARSHLPPLDDGLGMYGRFGESSRVPERTVINTNARTAIMNLVSAPTAEFTIFRVPQSGPSSVM